MLVYHVVTGLLAFSRSLQDHWDTITNIKNAISRFHFALFNLLDIRSWIMV